MHVLPDAQSWSAEQVCTAMADGVVFEFVIVALDVEVAVSKLIRENSRTVELSVAERNDADTVG